MSLVLTPPPSTRIGEWSHTSFGEVHWTTPLKWISHPLHTRKQSNLDKDWLLKSLHQVKYQLLDWGWLTEGNRCTSSFHKMANANERWSVFERCFYLLLYWWSRDCLGNDFFYRYLGNDVSSLSYVIDYKGCNNRIDAHRNFIFDCIKSLILQEDWVVLILRFRFWLTR